MALNSASILKSNLRNARTILAPAKYNKPTVKSGTTHITQPTIKNAGSGVGNWSTVLETQRDYNNAFNLAQTEALNEFNAMEAQKSRDWQERMSNTAHQREVQDLIAAGLNPVLSAGGTGAYVGSAAQASGSKATADDTLSSGLISLMGAMIAASSASTVANIYTANQRYMAENYPSNIYQAINSLFSNNDGSGSGVSNAKKFIKGLFK